MGQADRATLTRTPTAASGLRVQRAVTCSRADARMGSKLPFFSWEPMKVRGEDFLLLICLAR
jgi:hypothetical protein